MFPTIGISVKNQAGKSSFEHNVSLGTISFSEPPLLKHEFLQEFYIPSTYTISINLFGSEIGSINIKGSTLVVPLTMSLNGNTQCG
ncbi:MAG: hypothetical protein ACM3UZ_01750 [Acidobacteriota bacterium]